MATQLAPLACTAASGKASGHRSRRRSRVIEAGPNPTDSPTGTAGNSAPIAATDAGSAVVITKPSGPNQDRASSTTSRSNPVPLRSTWPRTPPAASTSMTSRAASAGSRPEPPDPSEPDEPDEPDEPPRSDGPDGLSAECWATSVPSPARRTSNSAYSAPDDTTAW